jgi:signal recognition particle subunit SEC65
MTADPSRMTLWTGYFDSRYSRKSGRRVSRIASIARPNLDQIALAARAVGITKMRRDQSASHPKRPYSKEGRLIVSSRDALNSTSSETKEQVLRKVGESLRNLAIEDRDTISKQPNRPIGREGARKAKQRKSPSRRPPNQRKKKFGRR